MRRHLILTLAIMIALTTILSAPIGSGPTPACAKQQFEQPEREREGDPEGFDPGSPSKIGSTAYEQPVHQVHESARRNHWFWPTLLRVLALFTRANVS